MLSKEDCFHTPGGCEDSEWEREEGGLCSGGDGDGWERRNHSIHLSHKEEEEEWVSELKHANNFICTLLCMNIFLCD